MPVFIFPIALIGLLAVPALVAIYWLRNRAREHQVSSLLLWLDEKQRWEGGHRLYHLQTPLTFFLELLAIVLFVTAAAGPMMRAGESGRPLVIVLDDSFSMLAGNEESSRHRALRAIEHELNANRYEPVHLVLAGESPQVLGTAVRGTEGGVEQPIKWLKDWKCASPHADLEEAIAFSFELGGSRARVLTITDHAPTQDLSNSRLQWWAFGSPRPNVAFVNATRSEHDKEERILLEIANLSNSSTTTTLSIESIDPSNPNNPQSAIRNPQSVMLGPNEARRIVLTVKGGTPPLRARLSDDTLRVDNEVVLMPEAKKTVRIDLRVRDATLRGLIERALQSTQSAILTGDKPQLVISDEFESKIDNADAWTLQILSEKDGASFLGPFVIDRAHPLSEGLSLGGVVWGSGKSTQFIGTPIITAGNIPLLTDVERSGKHELRLRLRTDLSTLQESPNWPILIWNLVNWRARTAPGLQQANIHIGSDATLTVESGVESAGLVDPQRNRREMPVRDKTVTIKAETIGVYELSANQSKYSFAANALQREESDLTKAISGRWGNWAKASELQWEYHSVAWVLLLLALIVLAAHAWLVVRNRAKG